MRVPGRMSRIVFASCTTAFLIAASCQTVRGQNQSRLPLPPDDVRSLVATGEAALEQADYSEALQRLQQVLDSDEDFFDPSAPHGSLKGRIDDLLGELPPDGRAVYERLFGPTARTLLDEAVAERDRGALSEVVRRYFWTEAGRDAALTLSDHLTDEGDVQGAGDLFDRLAQHPDVGPSLQSRLLLRSAFCWWVAGTEGTTKIRLMEREELLAGGVDRLPGDVAPSASEDALDWLSLSGVRPDGGQEPVHQNVMVFRGNSRRNGASDPAVPVGDILWRYPVVDEYDVWYAERAREVVNRVKALEQQYGDPDGPLRMLLPAGVPLIVGDLALFRGYGTLKAVSIETGELAWPSVHVDETFKYLVDNEWNPDEDWHTRNLDLFLAQRIWRDVTSASLSCNDNQVFTIADGGMTSPLSQMAVNMPDLSRHQLAPHPFNRMLAYDLRTGLLRWEAGGPPGPFDKPLTGVYFLGAPLPVQDKLYCIVEDRGQVRLVVINATRTSEKERVDVEWSQALYNPDVNLSTEIVTGGRRLSGLTPAISGNVIICPTGESTVVAVDRLRRTLLWAHVYGESSVTSPQQQAMQRRMLMIARQNRSPASQEEQLIEELLTPGRWADSAPMISGDLVVLTPSDSDAVHCLRLSTGEEVWRRPRGDSWYAAAIHAGRLVLVGRRQVEAVRLRDGRPAWDSAIPIPPPSGRGFRYANHYVLPLSTGEIATIDLNSGRIVARSKSDDGEVPGNLVAASGRILEQTPTGLKSRAPLAVIRQMLEQQLASSDERAEALARRGELLLHLGEEQRALDDLRLSNELEPSGLVRALIAETLIEGLRTDFPKYREAAGEIAKLAADQSQRSQFHRMYAEGLHRAGEVEAAYEQYLQYAQDFGQTDEMERIDASRLVRSDRWIRGRLEQLAEQADDQQSRRLNAQIAATIESALERDDSAMLQRLLEVLPAGEIQQRLRLRSLQQPNGERPWLELEQELLKLKSAQDPALQAYAVARLAQSALEAGERGPWLDRLTSDLAGPLADQASLDDRTGRQLLDSWRGNEDYVRLIDDPGAWPTGHIEVSRERSTASKAMFVVPRLGRASEMLEGWLFFVDQGGTNLIAFDQDGRQRWSHPTSIGRTSIRMSRGVGNVRYVSTAGRLVLMVTHGELTVFDALSGDDSPTVLFNESLLPESGTAITRNIVRFGNNRRLLPRLLRNQVFISPYDGQTAAGNVGPLTIDSLVFQVGRSLRAIDPYTGKALWTQQAIAPEAGSEILADDEFVVVWPPNSPDVTIYRAADGERVGARALPEAVIRPQPNGTWGRYLLTHKTIADDDGRESQIGLYDPARDEMVWQRSFVDAIDPAIVDGRDLCVLQRNGSLTLLDGMSGVDLATVDFPGETIPASLHVESDADGYYVSTFSAPENAPPDKRLIPLQQPPLPTVNGVVLAVNRKEGHIAWWRPVEYQQWQVDTPTGWPVLVFAAETFDPNPDADSGPRGHRTTVLVLNKQTGEPLFASAVSGRIQKRGWRAMIPQHELAVFHGPIGLSLKFSEEPPEPEQDGDPADDDASETPR